MATRTHPDLINGELSAEVKNGLRLAGFNLSDLSSDRPWTPDGDQTLIEYWERGIDIETMMRDFNRSEESVCSRLLYLSMQGRISRRKRCQRYEE